MASFALDDIRCQSKLGSQETLTPSAATSLRQ